MIVLFAPAEAMDAASTWHNNTNERITAAMDASIHVAQSMHRVADVLGARLEAALGARLEVGELSLEVGEVLRATVVATAATIVLTTLLLICARRHGPSSVESKKQRAPVPKKENPPKAPKPPRVRMCRFCNVEIKSKAFMDGHVAGKKHRKLAEGCSPDACWVWVDKVEEEKPVPTEAPAVVQVVEEDGSWQVVDNLAKKRAQKAAAAKKQEQEAKKAAEAAAKAEAPRALRVHRRCNECGIRAQDGATIETDPDNEAKAYCTVCWDRYYHPEMEPVAAPAAEPRKHVTHWDR